MKKVIMSLGSIPAKVDSVKYIMNRFKGRLAFKTALELLNDSDIDLTLVVWKYTDIPELLNTNYAFKIVKVDTIVEYSKVMQELQADAYILAAAVANIAPVNPWEGKFPSHEYKEGAAFSIDFCITNRIINKIKEWHPRSTLIGYKLFDGTDEELISAGKTVLKESNATIIFCNKPKTAKTTKIALTADGAVLPMSFEEHDAFIKRTIKSNWYRTTIEQVTDNVPKNVMVPFLSDRHIQLLQEIVDDEGHGCLAHLTTDGSLLTTVRKKPLLLDSPAAFCRVWRVISPNKVFSNKKATINAPTLWYLCKRLTYINFVIHGHWVLSSTHTIPYVHPGTKEEVINVLNSFGKCDAINIEGHGFYAGFSSLDKAEIWMKTQIERRRYV